MDVLTPCNSRKLWGRLSSLPLLAFQGKAGWKASPQKLFATDN
jgi:hypothetical protein